MSTEARIRGLSDRHRKLETEIQTERKHPSGSDMKMAQMKRKKLRIKDEIKTLQVR